MTGRWPAAKLRVFSIVMVSLLVGVGVSACQSKPASEVTKWRMATSWPADMLFYTEGAKAICDRVAELSGGRLVIEPYPADSIVGALEVFDAVSNGTVECAHTFPSYWRDKNPSFELFTSIPNQMVMQEWATWLYGPPRGIDLWQELYAKYNTIPFPGGLIGPEFGFFTTKPVVTLEDFNGLKLRASGMAADILQELGASTTLIPVAEIRSAIERGDIDGFEFSTPAVDWPLGLQEITPYVCLPCWHQPSAMVETVVNLDAWNKLPDDLKTIFEAACKEVGMVDFMACLEGVNAEYLSKFEQYGTQVTVLDTEAMERITEITNALADEQAAKDPFYAEVLKSQRDFRESYRTWERWGDYKLYPAE